MVHRKVGSIQWLRNMAPEQYNNFYQLASTMCTQQIEALVRRQVSTSKEEARCFAEDGEFRPLSFWKTLGYDGEAIEAKAPAEDRKIDPKYGWENFRVEVEKTSKKEDYKSTDILQVLAKARTRALKRRRTDEESLPQSQPASDSSFSDEASGGSSSEDPREKRRRRRAQGQEEQEETQKKAPKKEKKKSAAQVAKEKAAEKEKKSAQTAAKKLKETISGLRTIASHHLILDVPGEVLTPVQDRVRALQALERACAQAAQGKTAEWKDEFASLPWQAIKKEQATLKKKLEKLERAYA